MILLLSQSTLDLPCLALWRFNFQEGPSSSPGTGHGLILCCHPLSMGLLHAQTTEGFQLLQTFIGSLVLFHCIKSNPSPQMAKILKKKKYNVQSHLMYESIQLCNEDQGCGVRKKNAYTCIQGIKFEHVTQARQLSQHHL